MHDIEGLIRSQAGDRDEEWYSYERVFFTMRLWGSLGRVLQANRLPLAGMTRLSQASYHWHHSHTRRSLYRPGSERSQGCTRQDEGYSDRGLLE
jgi:hypothetical protein